MVPRTFVHKGIGKLGLQLPCTVREKFSCLKGVC